MACFDHVLHRTVDVPHKHHGGIGVDAFFPPAKGAVGHEPFHNLDAVFVFHIDAGHFVEGHHIPQAHQSHRPVAHVVKQIGYRGLSSGNEDGVWRNLIIYIRFPGTARAQFADVEVLFHKGNHSGHQMPFGLFVQINRLHPHAAANNIYPLGQGKLLPLVNEIGNIGFGHLNGLQLHHPEGRIL